MSNNEDKKIQWKHCPGCGIELPKIETIKFCINCGLDLIYVHEHKALPPSPVPTTYAPVQSYQPSISYYKSYEPIPEDEIFDTKGRVLWGKLASIGIPLLAFIVMNAILIGIIIALAFIMPIEALIMFVSNPFFLVFSTLIELILIIFPIWYVRNYVENPNLENRLILLGFTTKRYDRIALLKEIGIGIGFAFIGLGIVAGSSLLIQYILSLFGVRIVESSGTGDAEFLVSGMDILLLILMILMMIIIVGPCEEILFRGFMQRGLVRVVGDRWGILITAFLFAIIHLVALVFILFISPLVFLILFVYMLVPYFAISLMLGLLFRWRNENLIAVIITHGVYNSLTILIVFLFMFYS